MEERTGLPSDDQEMGKKLEVAEDKERRAETTEDAARSEIRSAMSGPAPVQRRVGFEFETGIPVRNFETGNAPPVKKPFYAEGKWHIEPDSGNMEFVTDPLSSGDEVFATVGRITAWIRELQALKSVLPEEQAGLLDKIEQERQKELMRGEEQEKKLLSINQKELINAAVEKFGVNSETVSQWISTYGVLAVEDVVADKQINKDAVPFLDMLLKMTSARMPIQPMESFQRKKMEIIEGYQFRRLDDMSGKSNLQYKNLAAIGSVDKVTAAPQATLGVSLDKLISAMHLIPGEKVYTGLNTPQEATHTLSSMNPKDGELLVAARRAALQLSKGYRESIEGISEKEWRQFEGLVALVVSYIMKGNQARSKPFKDAKEIAPLMSRLNFSVMYGALHPNLQSLFTSKNIAATAGVGEGDRVFGEAGFGQGKAGPTVKEWIVSIASGKDVMSALAGTDVTNEKVGGSSSMGAETDFDRVDSRAPEGLVPLELRRLPKGVDFEEWEMLAYQIYVFAEAMLKSKYY